MASRPFRFGVNCTTTSAVEWLEVARKAEALGFHSLIAQDHFAAQLGPLAALGAAAMVTSRLRLGTLVLDNDFRHPAVVAKEAATIDALSGGRMELGLGAGWLEADYLKVGISLDSPGVRLRRLSEAVRICRLLFTSETPVSFEGQHYCIRDLEPLPRPVQARLPIFVGGRLRNSLSLAAREADIVGISLLDRRMPGSPPPPTLSQKLDWVRFAAGERFADLELHVNASVVGITDRPLDAVSAYAERSGQSLEDALASPATLVGSVDAIVEKLQRIRQEFGISYFVVHARNMDALARIIPKV